MDAMGAKLGNNLGIGTKSFVGDIIYIEYIYIMARGRIGGGGGGIGGSGVYGLFGTVIQCKAEDNSMYCNIMKMFNLLIIVLVVVYLAYIAYTFFGPKKYRY
jgi:hypothetical protein